MHERRRSVVSIPSISISLILFFHNDNCRRRAFGQSYASQRKQNAAHSVIDNNTNRTTAKNKTNNINSIYSYTRLIFSLFTSTNIFNTTMLSYLRYNLYILHFSCLAMQHRRQWHFYNYILHYVWNIPFILNFESMYIPVRKYEYNINNAFQFIFVNRSILYPKLFLF